MIMELQQKLHDQRIEVDLSGHYTGIQDQIMLDIDGLISSLRKKLASLARATLAQLLALRSLTRREVQVKPDFASYLNQCVYTTEAVWQTNIRDKANQLYVEEPPELV